MVNLGPRSWASLTLGFGVVRQAGLAKSSSWLGENGPICRRRGFGFHGGGGLVVLKYRVPNLSSLSVMVGLAAFELRPGVTKFKIGLGIGRL